MGHAVHSSGAAGTTQQLTSSSGVSMLQQLLEDLFALGGKPAQPTATAEAAAAVAALPAALLVGAARPTPAGQPALATMLDGAAALLAGLVEHLGKQAELPLLPVLKVGRVCAKGFAQTWPTVRVQWHALASHDAAILFPVG